MDGKEMAKKIGRGLGDAILSSMESSVNRLANDRRASSEQREYYRSKADQIGNMRDNYFGDDDDYEY